VAYLYQYTPTTQYQEPAPAPAPARRPSIALLVLQAIGLVLASWLALVVFIIIGS